MFQQSCSIALIEKTTAHLCKPLNEKMHSTHTLNQSAYPVILSAKQDYYLRAVSTQATHRKVK